MQLSGPKRIGLRASVVGQHLHPFAGLKSLLPIIVEVKLKKGPIHDYGRQVDRSPVAQCAIRRGDCLMLSRKCASRREGTQNC